MISNTVFIVLALAVIGAIIAALMAWWDGISYERAVVKLWRIAFKSWEFSSVRVGLSSSIGIALWAERSQWGYAAFFMGAGAVFCASYATITLVHAVVRAIAHGYIMGSTEAITDLQDDIDPTEAHKKFIAERKPASFYNPSRRGGKWGD